MCGIVAVKRKDGRPAYKAVLKRYRHQKFRGQNGFGYVAIKDNQVVSYQRAPTEHEIVKLLEKEDAPEIWFHHRYPTSTPNVEEAAHPILIENDLLAHQYFVLHNGVIKNTKELREGHYKLGIKYNTEIMRGFTALSTKKHYTSELAWNDSESLAVETALAMDGLKKTIDTEGAAAVVGIQTKGRQVINRFFYRNDHHPLKFHEDKVMVTVTTLGAGEDLPTTLVYQLRDGGGYEYYGKQPIVTPKTSTYTYVQRDKDFYKTHVWDKDLKDYVPKTTLVLESDEEIGRAFGFNSGMRRVNGILLPAPKQRDLHFEDRGIQIGPEDVDPEPGMPTLANLTLREITGQLKVIERRSDEGLVFLKRMPLNLLHTEFEDAVELESSLKKALEEIDLRIQAELEPDEELIENRDWVVEQKQMVNIYLSAVSTEVTTRESQIESMLR